MQDPVPPMLTGPIGLAETLRSSWMRGWLFRLGFVYWMTFCVRLILGELQVPVLEWSSDGLAWLFDHLDIWIGDHVFGIADLDPSFNGSGDRTLDWIHLLDQMGLSLVGATVWAAIDRRRVRDAHLRELLQIAARYALGFVMFGYGMDKVFLAQFPAPSDGQLLQRWGDSSPMNVLWTFIGSSPPYEVFIGAAEVIGAALVLFRRTKTLGALLLAAVLVNVVMLNLCYDVPVKLFSMHLLALCLLLLLPETNRLLDLLVRHRAISARPIGLQIERRSWRIARWVVKSMTIAIVVAATLVWVRKGSTQRHEAVMQDHWSVGYWHATSFVRDGKPSDVADPTRWDRLRFQAAGDKLYARWRTMNGELGTLYDVTFDDADRVVRLVVSERDKAKRPSGPITLHYVHDVGDANHLVLTGQVGVDALDIQLERIDASHMLLRTRGFHWINEEPFNR